MAETKQSNANIYGYIRVSSISQDYTIQKNTIIEFADYRKLNILRIFQDKVSGKNITREGYMQMYDALKTDPQKVSAIAVTKIDRLGRNLHDLIEFTHWLDQQGIGLIIIESNIDTTTSEGRLFFHFMASIAEYERIRILERTTAGRQAAKAAGVKFGRRKKVLSMRDIERKIFEGVPISKIARDLKVSRLTIYRRLEEQKAIVVDVATSETTEAKSTNEMNL